jgi:hypothetical protein
MIFVPFGDAGIMMYFTPLIRFTVRGEANLAQTSPPDDPTNSLLQGPAVV